MMLKYTKSSENISILLIIINLRLAYLIPKKKNNNKNLVNEVNISSLLKNSDLNTKLATLATKA